MIDVCNTHHHAAHLNTYVSEGAHHSRAAYKQLRKSIESYLPAGPHTDTAQPAAAVGSVGCRQA